jgi:hypothetical protein
MTAQPMTAQPMTAQHVDGARHARPAAPMTARGDSARTVAR